MATIITPPSPATFYSSISSEGSMHVIAHRPVIIPLEQLGSTSADRCAIAEGNTGDQLAHCIRSSTELQKSTADTNANSDSPRNRVDIIDEKEALEADADGQIEGKPMNAVSMTPVAQTPKDRLPPSPPLTPVTSEENLRSTSPMRSQQSLPPELVFQPWDHAGTSTNNEVSQVSVHAVLQKEQESDGKSAVSSMKFGAHGVIRKNGKKYRIPHSSYYFKPPPDTSAYGTAPVGHMGVHHPREIVRIERDYSRGEVVQFSPAYPLELEGRATPSQFLETINAINERLIHAHSLRWSFFDNTIAFLTLHISRLLFKSHYDREMHRLQKFIDELNRQLYNPMGLNILWPKDVAFMFLEIEYY